MQVKSETHKSETEKVERKQHGEKFPDFTIDTSGNPMSGNWNAEVEKNYLFLLKKMKSGEVEEERRRRRRRRRANREDRR